MSKKIAPTSKEPVETMGRMELMQELAEWRTVGPALVAVARAVRKEHQFCPTFEKCPTCRALARLDRLSSGTGRGSRRTT